MKEETFFGWALGGKSGAVVSASYGRFPNGACMPVYELGPKILG
jgi:hypothetical protein